MKVLFIARPDLYKVPGGDTVQVEGTARYLRKLGVEVDVLRGDQKPDYAGYDLLHFFNIIDPEDILGHAFRCKKPYVISTIFVDYSEYDRFHRKDLIGWISRFFSYGTVEYLKTVAKVVLKGEKISTFRYFFKGHTGSVKYLLRNAACLLPNSNSEYLRLVNSFGIEQKYRVVSNGIDERLFSRPERMDRGNIILCVARLEGRKNQLNLIRSWKQEGTELHLVGKVSVNQPGYISACRKEASPHIYFHDGMSQENLIDFYKRARVHALPSWFETTGLSSLEAAAMGCNIVVSDRGDVREYFKDFAYYCDPASPGSIRNAILEAYEKPADPAFAAYVRKNFTWEKAAEQTLQAYRMVLENK